MDLKDRRISQTYTLPARLHEHIQELAARHDQWKGNRSLCIEHYLLKGLEAERQEKPLPPAA